VLSFHTGILLPLLYSPPTYKSPKFACNNLVGDPLRDNGVAPFSSAYQTEIIKLIY